MARMNGSRVLIGLGLCAALVLVAGCASRSGGGYYKDDGPGSDIPADILSVPDAVPRVETHARANFRPYTVFGQRYIPIGENQHYRQTGMASWYGRKFHGEKTANGETYDMYAMTAAHPTLSLPSYARVTRASTGRSVIVRVNDRGPFHSSRIIDLSYAAAAKLGLVGPGSAQVIVEAITNDDIRSGRYGGGTATATATAAPIVPVVAAPAVSPRQDAVHMPEIYLQFGAFSSEANAQALAGHINDRSGGLQGLAQVMHQDPLFKVRMGPYDSRTAAVNAAFELSESTGLHPQIALD